MIRRRMGVRWVTTVCLWGLLASEVPAGALTFPGSNLGGIPDGAGIGPRNYGATRDVRFEVSGVPGTLSGVGVQFAADHPFVGDLKVSLIAPTGVEHLLFESTGATSPTPAGSPANLVSANLQTFLEAGSNWWTNAGLADVNIPASTSRSVVAGPVAAPPPAVTSFNTAFLNQPANGTWILRFQDGWNGDVGSVTSANLLLLDNGATRTVTKVADTNDGVCNTDCSLREAIAVAAPGDLVSFASPFFDTPRAIVLGGSELVIDKTLAIAGPGAHRLTISANGLSRVFAISGVNRVTLTGMRLTDGDAGEAGRGGAIDLREAAMVLSGCEVSNSRAGQGGGIVLSDSIPSGNLDVYDSSVVGNAASNDLFVINGGGITLDSSGVVRLFRVTVSGNQTLGNTGAGGVYQGFGTIEMTDSTVTGNVGADAGGVRIDAGAITMRNAVIAGNRTTSGSPVDIGGSGISSLGHNLIGNPGSVTVFTQPGDQAGTGANPLDPKLGPLSHNGGTVPVHAPLQGSPLLDKGKAFSSDARGVARAFDLTAIAPATGGNNADIGAVEVAPQIVLNLNDGGAGSLRQALADAPVAPAVSDIWFDPAVTQAPATITLTSGQLSVDRNLAIHGPGAQRLTISGNRQSRVLAVQVNRRVGISGLTLTAGNGVGTPFSGEGGGALNAAGSHLTIARSTVQNSVGSNGGAIRNRDNAALVLRESTVQASVATGGNGSNGAGVASGSDTLLRIESSTISGNGRIDTVAVGGVFLFSGLAQVQDSTITLNRNSGLFSVGGLDVQFGIVQVRNSMVAANSSGGATLDLSRDSGEFVSQGYNLIGNPGAVTTFNQPSDQIGTGLNPLDPKLSPLAIHSGQTPTHMPLAGSPALDKGLRHGLDQRGLNGAFDIGTIAPATNGNNADIGAVEAQAIFVSNNGDSGADSLRQAVLTANANGPGTDDVLFSLSLPGTINLSTRLPQPTGSMNFDGPGAQQATITRAAGAPAFGLLDIFQPVQIGITGLRFANGLDDGSNGGDNFGGGIDAFAAELHLTAVELSANQSGSGAGVSLANANGVISDSAITANIASTQGGGIYFQGDNNRLVIRGSTIGSNAANGSGLGGGISHVGVSAAASRSLLEVSSSTIAGNGASAGAGIRTASVSATSTTATSLQNTLFANSLGSAHLVLVTGTGTASVISRGYNLSDTALLLLDQSSDRTNVNPQLGTLNYNGGPTRTFALQTGSAAIDGGIRTSSFNDQRGSGFARTVDLSPTNAGGGDGTDIGAFELQTEPVVPPSVVSIVRASPNPTTPGSAVTFTVTFSASVTGVTTTDFSLTTTGVSGASITSVAGSGSSYTVSVNVGSGAGTVRLDLLDDDTIVSTGIPLGGAGAGNGSFLTGEVYTVGAAGDQVFRNGFE